MRRWDWMDIVLSDFLFLFCIELLHYDSKKKKEKEGEDFRFEACVLLVGRFLAGSSLAVLYVGALILLCVEIDRREKRGLVACTIGVSSRSILPSACLV